MAVYSSVPDLLKKKSKEKKKKKKSIYFISEMRYIKGSRVVTASSMTTQFRIHAHARLRHSRLVVFPACIILTGKVSRLED